MELETDLGKFEILTEDDLVSRLKQLDPDTNQRAILSLDSDTYIQTAVYQNGFVIEKRSGSAETHMHARPLGRAPIPSPEKPAAKWWQKLLKLEPVDLRHDHAFSQDELIQIFSAYFRRADDPEFLVWSQGYH